MAKKAPTKAAASKTTKSAKGAAKAPVTKAVPKKAVPKTAAPKKAAPKKAAPKKAPVMKAAPKKAAPKKAAPKKAPVMKAAPKKAAEPPKATPVVATPKPPVATPVTRALPPLDGYTVTFVHPDNRTAALPEARKACEKAGAETAERTIPRQLVNLSRLFKVYGPTEAVAQTVASLVQDHLSLTPVAGDPSEKALYVFID